MKYKFRCECPYDADNIKEALESWLLTWSKTPLRLMGEDNIAFDSCTDLEVTFEIKEDGPDLKVIKDVIGSLIDCHVAADTVQLEENYTGGRD